MSDFSFESSECCLDLLYKNCSFAIFKEKRKTPAHTHFKTAIYDTNEGAGDIKAPLNLGDGALHIGSAEGFGKEYKRHRSQEELGTQKHTTLC